MRPLVQHALRLAAALVAAGPAAGCCPPGGPMPGAVLFARSDQDVLRAGTARPDGSLLLGGASLGAGWVLRTDPAGEVEWARRVGDSGQTDVHDLLLGPEGTVVVAGGSSSAPGGSAWLLALDESGEPLWQRHLAGSATMALTALAPGEDGGSVAAGFDTPEAERTAALVLRTDEQGGALWQHGLRLPGAGLRPTAVVATPDGALVAGTVLEAAERGWMASISEDGEILWALALGAAGADSRARPQDLVATAPGEVLAVGTVFGDGDEQRLWVARVSLDGDIVEQRALVQLRDDTSTHGNSWGHRATAAPGGGLFVAGEAGPTASDHSLLSLRLDEDLELAEVHLFHTIDDSDDGGPATGSQVGLDVVPLPGGGRAVVGSHEDLDWGPPPERQVRGWLLLLDGTGEPGPGCMASFATDLAAYAIADGPVTAEPLELEVTTLDAPTDSPALPVVEEPDPETISTRYHCPPPRCEGLM